MKIEKISEPYLFEKHSRAVIKEWNRKLKYGFYKRAWGGHANDGDAFGIWLKYDTTNELFTILNELQIKLKKTPKNHPKAIIGKKYKVEEYLKFKSTIKDFPEFEQPLNINLKMTPCFCWIGSGQIKLTFSGQKDGNNYEVSEIDFENCLRIENIILNKNLGNYISSEYQNYATNISKRIYPELFD